MPGIGGHGRHGVRRVGVVAMLAGALMLGATTTTAGADDRPGTQEPAAPGYPWTWPVSGPRTVVEPFVAPAHDYGPGHRGMDVVALSGTEVRSPAAGVVAFRGVVVDRPLITIDHGAGHVTTLEPVRSALVPGARVTAGQVVGTTATGGHSARGTLHVGVRVHEVYVNPRPLFGAVPRAVLLPCCE
ncbi:murein hydrolase activator EnvC family protein [Microbacterium sp. NPDC058345]|uniref:murein hydrolase activator EnvC family protein n=1 Tax=Microbacterium sp. NPDC058345 TaxID=3346455 RepID=UPI00364A6ACB